MAQCKAKSKRSGSQCRRRAVKGRDVCMMHGGKSLSGVQHPNFKTGAHIYGGALPQHIAQQVAAVHGHPDALTVSHELDVQRARAYELLDRIREHGGGTWKEVADAWDELQEIAHNAESTPEEIRRATKHVDAIIKNGLAVDYNWRQHDGTVDRISRLVQQQAQREEFAQSNLKQVQAMMYIVRLGQACKTAIGRHITEDNLNNLTADELQRRINADVSDACRAIAAGGIME